MKSTAQKSAIAQVIYNELRFAEVILFLIHRAEEESNAEMFVEAMKCAFFLFTTNHASKYTNIAAEFLVWWLVACSSPAEKVFSDKFILTRKTNRGKRIFTDRFVKWLMKDVRAGVGKHNRQRTDAALVRQVALLNAPKRFEASLNGSDKHKGNKKQNTKFVKPFAVHFLIVWTIRFGADETVIQQVELQCRLAVHQSTRKDKCSGGR